MNIDIECISLLGLILQDSPQDRELILCVLARSNSNPTRITFHANTDYPTFYGYANSRIPLYLMGEGVLSNVPRQGYYKRIISSNYLSRAETIINKAKNWDMSQKLMHVSKFLNLDNKTAYKDTEVFLIFRDKTIAYIRDYAMQNKDTVSQFLGPELSSAVIGNQNVKSTNTDIKNTRKATYDTIRRLLSINGKQIKYKESKRADIIKLLFEEKDKVFTDDILDKVYGIDISTQNGDEAEKTKKMIYAQFRAISQGVATSLGVQNFLIFDFNSAQIDPSFL